MSLCPPVRMTTYSLLFDASCVHDHDQDEMRFIVDTCNQIYRYYTITKNDSKSIGKGVYCNISPSIKKKYLKKTSFK